MQMEKGEGGGRTDIIMESHRKTWIRGCVGVIGQAVMVPEPNPGTVAFLLAGRPVGAWARLYDLAEYRYLPGPSQGLSVRCTGTPRLSPVGYPCSCSSRFNCLLEDFSSLVSYLLSYSHLLCQTRVIGMPGCGMWNRAQRLFRGRHHFHHFVVPHTDQSVQI